MAYNDEEWIPMRINLADDPAVIQMADKLDIDEDTVIGRLHRVWSWVSRQCNASCVTGVTPTSLSRAIHRPGFAEAMVSAGWLNVTSEGWIDFPKFERWLSQGAKRRRLTAKRARAHRESKRNENVTQDALRNDDESATPSLSISNSLDLRSTSSVKQKKKRAPGKAFTPPTVDEVRAYCAERANQVDSGSFVDYYSAQGWKLANGRSMTDWQAAVRTWEKRNQKPQRKVARI